MTTSKTGCRARIRGAQFALLLAVLMTALSGCGAGEEDGRRVVVYVSADDYLAREVIARFETTTGIRVDMVGDSEVNKTTGLANRLRAEADKPSADVFWSSECFMMIQLADEGILASFDPDTDIDWPASLTGPDHLWHGFGTRARVIVYSPDRLPESKVPDRWTDLADPEWRGRVVMADPRFGTTRGHMGALKLVLGNDYTAHLAALGENDVRMLTSGNAGVVQAVARGEADLGMTDTDDVWAAQRNGHTVALVYPSFGEPDAPGGGTLLIPNTVALVKGAPNRAEGQEFIQFMLSAEVERMLVESDSHNIPVRESIAAEHEQYAVPSRLEIDLAEVANVMDDAVVEAMRILDG